jgi:hypothetical protein
MVPPMSLPDEAIRKEVERFKRLTQEFRQRVDAGAAQVGEAEPERERVYEILVSINHFLEEKLRKT